MTIQGLHSRLWNFLVGPKCEISRCDTSMTRERRQRLMPRDKQQQKEKADHLLRCLQDGLGTKIFLDELNPYHNSTKDR